MGSGPRTSCPWRPCPTRNGARRCAPTWTACCTYAAPPFVSSTAGQRGEAFHADYAATKGAVISFTKSLAVELAPRRINVNCVAPGWVDTEMSATPFAREAGRGKQEIVRTIPLGRLASPEDCAGPIVFLCSDLAGHITGEILNVNGGSVLCGLSWASASTSWK